ncbi:MAG TPA: sensor histidine kinase [Mycobacteriales bacterium]|nr:sensor histidine kinase [Mycobacteriales bacterium]
MQWGRRARQWLQGHPAQADALLALVLTLGCLSFAIVADAQRLHQAPGHVYRPFDVVNVLIPLGYAGALMWRRTLPIAALAWLSGLSVISSVLHLADLGFVAFLICIYSVARYRAPRPALAAAAGSLATGLITTFTEGAGGKTATASFLTVMVAIAFVVGRNVRTRQAYLEALEERARRAEAERETTARTAVMDERRRIARELHDLVAHHVSVMRVLAEGSRRLMHRDPDRAAEALGQIDGLGREALQEMRRILDVLRSDDEPDESPTEPNPGTATLEALAEQVSRAGLPVHLEVIGERRPLSAGADLSAFRIVQEALTNTLKHGGPYARARVEVRYGTRRLEIDVEDDGRGASAHGTDGGHGLLGMRERVGVYGGELTVGPRSGGGFIVHATLPYDNLSPERETAVP